MDAVAELAAPKKRARSMTGVSRPSIRARPRTQLLEPATRVTRGPRATAATSAIGTSQEVAAQSKATWRPSRFGGGGGVAAVPCAVASAASAASRAKPEADASVDSGILATVSLSAGDRGSISFSVASSRSYRAGLRARPVSRETDQTPSDDCGRDQTRLRTSTASPREWRENADCS